MQGQAGAGPHTGRSFHGPGKRGSYGSVVLLPSPVEEGWQPSPEHEEGKSHGRSKGRVQTDTNSNPSLTRRLWGRDATFQSLLPYTYHSRFSCTNPSAVLWCRIWCCQLHEKSQDREVPPSPRPLPSPLADRPVLGQAVLI